jgi:tetrahydromethanopterin S-methyltransferase subunit F
MNQEIDGSSHVRDEDKIDRIVSDVRDEAHLIARRATQGKYE